MMSMMGDKKKPSYEVFRSDEFKINYSAISVNRVAILCDERSAEVYLEKIFPEFPHCYFITLDGSYPKNRDLREILLNKLDQDENLSVILFTLEAFSKVSIKSQKVLSVDSLIRFSNLKWNAYKHWQADLDEWQIIKIMHSFFTQWDAKARKGDWSSYYRENLNVNQDALDWRLDLIAGRPSKPKQADLV